jgi:microsomal dipeptidase-like Zn-dependent dipeptidase/gamma-glutamyl-gamma-aminobutyrate hydrolase PuuD
MKSFHLQSHLNEIHATFPEAKHRPVIGITANYANEDACLRDRYYKQVVDAGGTPFIIPPVADKHVIINTLEHIDALLLTGGGDYNPLWCNEEPSPRLHAVNATRDLPELLITRLAFNRQIPMLGICRGIQTLAIALDGHVAQDISGNNEGNDKPSIKHSQDADRNELTHSITIAPDSHLFNIYKSERIYVNSFHHQAVDDPGKRFRTTATAPDGTIEAIESCEFKPIMGVQWHPEWLEEEGLKLFQWLVAQANNFHVAKQLHGRLLTLDTHCDTPMFFPQGIQFNQRDPRILVDLHKMDEGHQDAVIMAAYLPQPKLGETFSSKVDVNWGDNTQQPTAITPTVYADLIFDKIEDIVHDNSQYISIARTPADLYEDKRKGRKSIMMAIENGLALEHNLANVKHFAQRGVVYITLCHNGDNDICDSAKGCNTHNGVSQYGEKVIAEMNDYGIMVDLSHASEKSFYDALQISRTPIVCSHSNCRALCDHPRNLTDDQLRALAARGGVAHTTLYAGFLRKDGQATILDAIRHLEHAIDIMGIDNVGLGTDFDGDGGVPGLADSSELINFTLHLLRRKYSEAYIRKIWGGNWLRVMAQVQSKKNNS